MSSAEYKHERSKWLKAHGICVSCGNADAEPGRTRCRACLDVHAAAARRWRERHPDYARQYYYAHPGQWRNSESRKALKGGAGRLAEKKPKIAKPPGTCRRKGCWESTLPFSCWCRVHKDDMRERRCLNDYLKRSASKSTVKCSLHPGS